MVRALAALERGGLAFTPQADEGVTYARKIEKAETRIDWTRPATEVHNHIRGLVAVPRRLVRAGRRYGSRCCARPCRGNRRARHRLGRALTHRLRRGRGAAPGAAARRQGADAGGDVPARHPGRRRRQGRLTAVRGISSAPSPLPLRERVPSDRMIARRVRGEFSSICRMYPSPGATSLCSVSPPSPARGEGRRRHPARGELRAFSAKVDTGFAKENATIQDLERLI